MKKTNKYYLTAAAGYILFSVIFFISRARLMEHLLMWDEAWNILSLRAVLAGTKQNPFYWYYFFHPPLYTLFAGFLMPFVSNFASRAAFLSLIFSFGTFTIVYIFALRLGGLKYSWASCFFLSILPAAIGYDTWIKRDSLAMCFGYSALLMIFKKKYFPAALLLGLSLLSKETALFFILTGLICVLVSEATDKTRIIIISLIVITVLNAWWYLYMSSFTGNLFSYYLSPDTISSIIESSDMLYYLRKLPIDCGWITLLFFITGLFGLIYLIFEKNQKKWIYPVSVFFCVYFPLSFIISSKAPWQIVSALPAIAMISGAGLIFILKAFRNNRLLKTLIFLMLLTSLLTAMNFSYEAYHSTVYPNGWPGAKASRNLAEYLNRNMSDGDKILISDFAYWNEDLCPVFTYYWKGQDIIFLREKDLFNIPFIEKSINNCDIEWLIIPFSPDKDTKRHKLAREISKRINRQPLRLGWVYIWELRNKKTDESLITPEK